MRNLFENAITRVVVMPPVPMVYTSLKEMMYDNYKILLYPNMMNDNMFRKGVAMDFRRNDISQLLNHSYLMIDLDRYATDEAIGKQYLQHPETARYALLFNDSMAELNAYHCGMIIVKRTKKNLACYRLKELLNLAFHLWQIYAVNRNWLMISLRQMMESGLYGKWEKWQIADLQTMYRGLHNSSEQFFQDASFQVVEFDHLAFIILTCISILLASVVSFSIEMGQRSACAFTVGISGWKNIWGYYVRHSMHVSKHCSKA